MNTRAYMAVRTPRSRTFPALSPNASRSASWRPNSFTSSAPATPSRSVMSVFMSALCSICRRARSCRRLPTRLAGRMNTGRSARASRVSRQSRMMNIVSRVITSTQKLDTSWPSVPVMARCAPITSLFRRLISAPVWTLVKNDTPMRCTWSYSATRRS